MARKQKRKAAKKAGLSIAAKLLRVLGMLVVKGMDPEEAAVRLSGAGFDAEEISAILLVNKNYVHVANARWKGKSKARQKLDGDK